MHGLCLLLLCIVFSSVVFSSVVFSSARHCSEVQLPIAIRVLSSEHGSSVSRRGRGDAPCQPMQKKSTLLLLGLVLMSTAGA